MVDQDGFQMVRCITCMSFIPAHGGSGQECVWKCAEASEENGISEVCVRLCVCACGR